MFILLRPLSNSTNSYTMMVGDALLRRGHSVSEFHSSNFFMNHADVIVIHWPNEFFVITSLKSIVKSIYILIIFTLNKFFRKQRIVWFVHNIVPHDPGYFSFGFARRYFFRLIDGLVFLSEASRLITYENYPELDAKPYVVISHGDYRSLAHGPIKPLILPAVGPLLLAFTGQVRRYKAPDALLRAAAALPPGEVEISISGSCKDLAFAGELERLAQAIAGVRLDLRYLSNKEIEATIDAAHAIVLPYRSILNSGSALLALSRARPVLAPRLGSLIELQGQVGTEWVYLYDGDFNENVLSAFLIWLKYTPRPTVPDLSAHDWDTIGAQLSNFFKTLAHGESVTDS